MPEKRARCPNGSRKNKKGKCVSKAPQTTKKIKRVIKKKSIQLFTPREKNPVEECKKLFELIKSNNDLLKLETKDFFSIKKCQSEINKQELKTNDTYDFLYPHLDDPSFTQKITKKKEFFDTAVEKITREQIENIEAESNKLCDVNREFELAPHQMFVRNFLSFQTPYNSLLLFHGLGTGKTCSSISVCEEMRSYYNQLGITKKIIIVASPTVQTNYRLQLFDHRKLKNINGSWNLKSCTGNKFINEINPMHMKGLSRDKLISQIEKIINQSYEFMGYTGFANYIDNIIKKNLPREKDSVRQRKNKIKALRHEFSNRLITIDEVHNIRNVDGMKGTSEKFLELVTYAENMKLLLLTATPMFNDYREILWLTNLMNLNDNKYPILNSDVFDSKGKITKKGKELLIQKLIGYVSYVKGEHPFSFPYRIWPNEFNNPHSLIKLLKHDMIKYPKKQINDTPIKNPIKLLDLVYIKIGTYQQKGYEYIINKIKKKIKSNKKKGLSYTILDPPLQALNMIYPHENLENKKDKNIEKLLYGGAGLNRVMKFNPMPPLGLASKAKTDFEYKSSTLKNWGSIFSPKEIKKYSTKIHYIMSNIKRSTGIIMIYSQFIDGGCVPLALALEEIGITRYGKKKSLFKTPPSLPLDSITLKNSRKPNFPAKYIMITGDKYLSGPRTTINNKLEIDAATNSNNINGERVKVIIISKAGSEGLDFSNIRQIHILEPWYNLNRTDQIIGRAVRNKSHCNLSFIERNVEIYLYGTQLNTDEEEAIDMYMYRFAEKKGMRIGEITRLLKEISIDCLLNKNNRDLTEKNMNKKIQQRLSSGEQIDFFVGEKNNSIICDFMDCEYTCKPTDDIPTEIDYSTYNETFIIMNIDKILQRIRLLFKEKYVYNKNDLVKSINIIKSYPIDQIMTALDFLINNKNEYIIDSFGNSGKLINIDNYYLYQPVEIDDVNISIYKRQNPIEYKRNKLTFIAPKTFTKTQNINLTIHGEKNLDEILIKINDSIELIKNPLENMENYLKKYNSKNWPVYSSWAIQNLHKYNKIDMVILLQLAVNHIIDSINYKNKVLLVMYIYKKNIFTSINKNISPENEFFIKNFFDRYKVSDKGITGVVLVNYDKPTYKKTMDMTLKLLQRISILGITDDDVIENDKRTQSLSKYTFDRLKINISELNNIFGFMDMFKKQDIVFKFQIIDSDKKYKNKGKVCIVGVVKKDIIKRINNASGFEKYILNKSIIKEIRDVNGESYDNKKFKQEYILKNKLKDVRITSEQLCAENELLYRYNNHIKKDNKLWFLSTVESTRNNIMNHG